MRRIVVLGSLLAAAFFLAEAKAAVITQTRNFEILFQSRDPDAHTELSFDPFDPTLGTLNSVTYMLDSTFMIGSFDRIFTAIDAGSFGGVVKFTFPATLTSAGVNFSREVKSEGGCTDFADLPGDVCENDSDLMLEEIDHVAVASLPDDYIGSSVITAALGIVRNYEVVEINNATPDVGIPLAVWSGTLHLIYDYTPSLVAIPEPATASLLAPAVLAAAGRRRKTGASAGPGLRPWRTG